MEKYVFISGVCKYHVHQDVWKPLTGEKPLLLNKGSIINIQEFQVAVNTVNHLLHMQVLTIHLHVGKISVEFTSSENIANNFAVEWRFHTNNNWNAVSQAESQCLKLLE